MLQETQHASRSAQSRFFAYIQRTAWYRAFLQSVVVVLSDLAPGARVLDVGTGPGKLLVLLRQGKAIECVGVDADLAMLNEARRNPALAGARLVLVPAGEALPFPPQSFDAICFCSVLYLMEAGEVRALLHQAQTLLRSQGRIVILTPSGAEQAHLAGVRHHWTFHLWRRLTSATGRAWQQQHLARDFAERNEMVYASHLAFSQLATVEVLTAP